MKPWFAWVNISANRYRCQECGEVVHLEVGVERSLEGAALLSECPLAEEYPQPWTPPIRLDWAVSTS
jgi:hypothetical protein